LIDRLENRSSCRRAGGKRNVQTEEGAQHAGAGGRCRPSACAPELSDHIPIVTSDVGRTLRSA
jgi:hypothetical protein